MHDCALGREKELSAPRVEHRYYAGDGIMVKTWGRGGCKNVKIKTVLIFFILNRSRTKRL